MKTTQNITVGAGKAYLALLVNAAIGQYAGERYLGDSPQFALQTAAEGFKVYDSDEQVQTEMMDVTTRISRTANLTLRDISIENLALFVMGDVDELEQDDTAIVDEEHLAVEQGHYYQLGMSVDRPTGARMISDVVVTDDGDPGVTFDEGDDYEVDAELGRIYIVPGGAIENGTNLEVSCDVAEASWQTIAANRMKAVKGRLRYIANNTEGENRDVMGPLVEIRPTGDVQFKDRTQPVQIPVQITFLDQPGTGIAPLYIDGRPVAVA